MKTVAEQAVTANPSKYANNSATYGVSPDTLINNLTDYGLSYDSSAEEGSKFTVTDNGGAFAARLPNGITLSGYYSFTASGILEEGTTGRYITATSNSDNSRRQYFDSTTTEYASNKKSLGYSMRCIRK